MSFIRGGLLYHAQHWMKMCDLVMHTSMKMLAADTGCSLVSLMPRQAVMYLMVPDFGARSLW